MDISAVWGVKPNDVPWSFSDVLKVFTIATGLEGIIVDLRGLIEFVGVTRQTLDSVTNGTGECLIMDERYLEFALMYSG